MSNSEEDSNAAETSAAAATTPPLRPATTAAAAAAVDVESQRVVDAEGFGVSAIVRRWRRDDKLKRATLALRGIALLFSLLAFIIMATNYHGGWQNFYQYQEYNYVLAIAILSTLYTGSQALRQVHELSTGKQMFPPMILVLIDFIGDQICAYLLISAAASAVPLTNRMRTGADNIFTDSSASAISMEFLAFITMALSALVTGYKFSTFSYI